jgi:hypothetical protein
MRLVVRRRRIKQPVRIWLEPGHVGDGVQRRYPAGAAPEHVEADARGDAVKPGAEERAAVEALAAAPGVQERLLHGIFGLLEGGEHAVAVDVEFAAMALDKSGKGAFVAGQRGGNVTRPIRRHRHG